MNVPLCLDFLLKIFFVKSIWKGVVFMIYYVARREMNKSIRFLSSIFVLAVFGVMDAYAVPTVRLLGTNNPQMAGKTVNQVTSASVPTSVSTSRVGTTHPRNVTVSAPVTIKKTTAKPTSVADDSRLSIGKYIHTTGVSNGTIKPSSASDISASSNDLTSLADRVSALEAGMGNKQDLLIAGAGVVIEDNTISLDPAILDLPDQLSDLRDELTLKTSDEVLLEQLNQYFYTKEQVVNVLDEQIGSDINTIYDKATGRRVYVSIMDVFDPAVLTVQEPSNNGGSGS